MNAPTCGDLFQEELGDPVLRTADDSWRHGSVVSEVYERASDGTFWKAVYQRQTDGEYNGLREGDADITQVEPYAVVTVKYRPVEAP